MPTQTKRKTEHLETTTPNKDLNCHCFFSLCFDLSFRAMFRQWWEAQTTCQLCKTQFMDESKLIEISVRKRNKSVMRMRMMRMMEDEDEDEDAPSCSIFLVLLPRFFSVSLCRKHVLIKCVSLVFDPILHSLSTVRCFCVSSSSSHFSAAAFSSHPSFSPSCFFFRCLCHLFRKHVLIKCVSLVFDSISSAICLPVPLLRKFAVLVFLLHHLILLLLLHVLPSCESEIAGAFCHLKIWIGF